MGFLTGTIRSSAALGAATGQRYPYAHTYGDSPEPG